MPSSIHRRRANRRVRALNRAVWGLPLVTRQAMLDALEADELIAGAYTDRYGRACPVLAAHRRGARHGGEAFPGAWDAFTRARRPRAATARELDILRALLEESLRPPERLAPAGAPPAVAAERDDHRLAARR